MSQQVEGTQNTEGEVSCPTTQLHAQGAGPGANPVG